MSRATFRTPHESPPASAPAAPDAPAAPGDGRGLPETGGENESLRRCGAFLAATLGEVELLGAAPPRPGSTAAASAPRSRWRGFRHPRATAALVGGTAVALAFGGAVAASVVAEAAGLGPDSLRAGGHSTPDASTSASPRTPRPPHGPCLASYATTIGADRGATSPPDVGAPGRAAAPRLR